MFHAKRYRGWLLGLAGTVLAGLAAFAWMAGFFDKDPDWFFGTASSRPAYVAVLFSGDAGLRFGMGSYITAALNRNGTPVLGVSSPAAFATRKSRAQVDSIVALALRKALQRTGASK